MQIIVDRANISHLRLTKTEQGILLKAASLMRRINRNLPLAAGELVDAQVAEVLEEAAQSYGPKDKVATK